MHGETLCTVKHCALWNIVYCGTLCTVKHCARWNIEHGGTLCTAEYCARWNIVHGETLCTVEHCVVECSSTTINGIFYKMYKLLGVGKQASING